MPGTFAVGGLTVEVSVVALFFSRDSIRYRHGAAEEDCICVFHSVEPANEVISCIP